MSESDGRVEQIAMDALEVEPAHREQFVRDACGEDSQLLPLVFAWLDACDRAEGFLQTPALAAAAISDPLAGLGSGVSPDEASHVRFSGYEILGELGRGGMGIVFLACQQRPRRLVALKLILPGLVDAANLRRFEREAEILGRLQHPSIAQIYEAGTASLHGRERPFIVMEFVRGTPLVEYLRATGADVRARVELLAVVCDAVEHAHQYGVVHRDLKPGNILVDSGGRPKILDFGVARATDGDVQITSMRTDVRQLIGTLAYMSPEQARGDSRLVDARSDVYALGVILYEVLSGTLPLDLRDRSIPEAVRLICDQEAAALSRASSKLRGDLQTIAAKALDKVPARRYASAALMALDLRHFLSDEPIVARPASALYKVRKFANRNKALVAGTSASIASLAAGTGVAINFAVREQHRRIEAERGQYVALVAGAESALDAHAIANARDMLDRAPTHLRGWEWKQASAACDSSLLHLGHAIPDALRGISRDGSRFAAADHRGTAMLWDTAQEQPAYELNLGATDNRWIAVNPEAELIAETTSSGVRLRSFRDGRVTASFPTAEVNFAEFDPDGTQILTSSSDHTAHIWSVATGRLISTMQDPVDAIRSAVFGPNGSQVLISTLDGSTCLWETSNGRMLFRIPGLASNMSAAAFSPSGGLCAVGADRTVQVWEVLGARLAATLTGHREQVTSIRFSANGTHLVTASTDRTARIWDVSTGNELQVLVGHDRSVSCACFSPDGLLVATTSQDRTVRIWDSRTGKAKSLLLGHEGSVNAAAFLKDGSRLITAADDGSACLWDPDCPGAPAMVCSGEHMNAASFSQDGTAILTASHSEASSHRGVARVWRTADFQCLAVMSGHTKEVWNAAFNADATRVVTASEDHSARIWDIPSASEVTLPLQHSGWVNSASFNSRGDRVVTASGDATAGIWDAVSGTWLTDFPHPCGVCSAVFVNEGKEIVTGSEDGKLRFWRPPARVPFREFVAHQKKITAVTLSPDGGRILSSSLDGTALAWDLRNERPLLAFKGHTGPVLCAVYSPDMKRVVTASWDESVRVWDANDGAEVAVLRTPPDHQKINWVAFDPIDGSRLLVTTEESVLVYDALPWKQRRVKLREIGPK